MFGFYTNVMPGGSGFQCGGGGNGDARSHGHGQHHGHGHGHGYGYSHGHRHGAGRSEGGDPRQCGDGRSGRGRPEFATFAAPSAGRCGPGGGRGPGGFGGAPGGPGDPGSFGPGGPRGRGARMFDPGALRLIVLQMIQESPRHGYEIIKVLEERIGGMYSPSPGVIYPILSMYEDMGYIASTPEGNKKLYAITDEGRGYLTQHAAYIAHLQAQMAAAGQGRDEGEVRQSMHALRAVLVERLRHGKLDATRLARIKEILQAAQDDIEKL